VDTRSERHAYPQLLLDEAWPRTSVAERVAALHPFVEEYGRRTAEILVVAGARCQDPGLRDAGLTAVEERREAKSRDGPFQGTYAPEFGVPFGGFKSSGIGREYGPGAFDEYVEIKSVYGVPV